ncbi:pyrimidine reductase family protein [Streptomyces sp. NPDC056716]|uniref:pyrimidine reductase family protein n=1 Tax=unclassified Streptomyces TaxID=2593676 RepID=UPI0036BFAB54
MRRLFPVTDETTTATGGGGSGGGGGGATGGEWSLDALADAYAYPSAAGESGGGRDSGGARGAAGTGGAGAGSGAWLRANMVSTLDGAAQHDGRSQPISCAADMRLFGVLRALADVVVVGAETVRQEQYRPARARSEFAARRAAAGQAQAPAIAVISAGLDLDFSLPLFTEPLVPTLVLTGSTAPPERVAAAERAGVRVVVAGDGPRVEPAQVAAALAGQGHRRLLTEGGPRLLGQFVAAGVLDELCLTLAPMLTAGDAQRIAGGPRVIVPERFELVSLLEEAGFLFGRYRRP